MAYKTNNTVTIADDRSGSFANVTIQNNGFLEVNSSDGFQGTVAGYTSGGFPITNVIDKFPFAADANATDVGDLGVRRQELAGMSSQSSGYAAGGFLTSRIDKFPFASDTNAFNPGNLLAGVYNNTGQSSSSFGYSSGGVGPGPGFAQLNTIQKFSFAVDSNATDVGDLDIVLDRTSGQSSTASGYVSGGRGPGPSIVNVINKFPFSTDTNATDVGDLTQARQQPAGQSSTTHGYASGGQIPAPNTPPIVNTIDKFPFASDTNATDIADLTQIRVSSAGQSSTIFGYTSGGVTAFPGTRTNVIDKFPFSSDTNATDVGDLTETRNGAAGQQD
jgi:hypothetical protein